jgi:hypothetical protein
MLLQTNTVTIDPLIGQIIIALIALIAAGYGLSLLIQKRAMDSTQTVAAATLTATQNLIAQMTYYGAYERAEILRTVASIVGVDQVRDTALAFQQQRQLFRPYEVEYYPPQQKQ